MEDFNSETDSDYTSYWRDWVSFKLSSHFLHCARLDDGRRHDTYLGGSGNGVYSIWTAPSRPSLVRPRQQHGDDFQFPTASQT